MTTPIGDIMWPLISSWVYDDERAPWAPDRRGTARQPLPRELRQAVLTRDGYTCQWCHASARRRALLAIDHIVPWAAGGADHPVNLRTLCDPCNQDRSNRITDMHTAQALAIAWRCLRCALPRGNGTSVTAYCLGCRQTGSSPFMLVGGRIPTVGVPPAALVALTAAVPVIGERPVKADPLRLARARAELDRAAEDAS